MSTVSQEQKKDVGSLVKLIEVLKAIDVTSSNAKINSTSISDNNGGRIIL